MWQACMGKKIQVLKKLLKPMVNQTNIFMEYPHSSVSAKLAQDYKGIHITCWIAKSSHYKVTSVALLLVTFRRNRDLVFHISL